MTAPDARPHPASTPEEVAERLKERIYITFTSLAVVLALAGHTEGLSAGRAAATLVLAVAGTLLAVFAAGLMSHTVVHEALPDRARVGHMVSVLAAAAGVVVVPLILLALAAGEVLSVEEALRWSTAALVLTLGLVGWLAVRRVSLGPWVKLGMLGAEVLLAVVIIGLEILAHG